MNKGQILTKARRYCKAGTGSYSDADMLIDLNLIQGEILMMILASHGYSNINLTEAYADLVDGDDLSPGDVGYNGEYPFPTDLLRPVRAEIQYDSSSDPVPVKIYDQSENPNSEQNDEINDQFSEDKPYIKFGRDSYFIRPIPEDDMTAGLHIWYVKRQDDLSEDTDVPILDQNFHRIYPLKLAVEYSLREPKLNSTKWERQIAILEDKIKEEYRSKLKFRKVLTPEFDDFT
jgi:hypothetical protein